MRLPLLLLALFLSQSIHAATLKLNYSLFFGYMKTMHKLDYQDVTIGFYLVEPSTREQCGIEQAEIVVDNKREKIDFQVQGRLLPFYSDTHRKDGAMIEVKTVDEIACALQVTPMVKEAQLSSLSFEKLVSMSTQLEGILRKNAGMIGRYFLPSYQGLRFKLFEPLEQSLPVTTSYLLAANGDLLITNAQLQASAANELLPYKVLRITPWIVK